MDPCRGRSSVVERQLPKLNVASSILVARSTRTPPALGGFCLGRLGRTSPGAPAATGPPTPANTHPNLIPWAHSPQASRRPQQASRPDHPTPPGPSGFFRAALTLTTPPPRYSFGHPSGDNPLRGAHEEEGRHPAGRGGSVPSGRLRLCCGSFGARNSMPSRGNQALQEFRDLYNHQWLIERHNHRPPAQVRQDLLGTGAAA